MARTWQTSLEDWSVEDSHLLDLPHDLLSPTTERPAGFRLRQAVFYLLIILVFAAFTARLWQLQVVERDEWAYRAEKNRSRLEAIPAPRGIIYDRYGEPLVRNIPQFVVSIIPAYLPETPDGHRDPEGEARVFARLSELLQMPVTTISGTVPLTQTTPLGIKDIVDQVLDPQSSRYAPYRPVVIKTGVEREAALIILEEAARLPGVRVDIKPIREYPAGPIYAPLLGYMTRIPSHLAETYQKRGYDVATDLAGMVGIEYTAEEWLRGVKGTRYIEEDVAGRQVRILEQTNPLPGHNVYLSIDAGLQKFAYETLQAAINEINRFYGDEVTRRGAVIALHPQTGEVLAMVSLPSYDNNLFTQGVAAADYHDQLQALLDDPHRPLLNHAITDRLQPGSTFKIIVAAAGLQEGIITAKTKINDPGTIVIPDKYFPNDPGRARKFSCWNKAGHGYLDVVHAIAESCNIFFYEVGGGLDVPDQPKFTGLGEKLIGKYARLFGLGTPTGIDLPGEAGGHVPDATWKRKTFGENWSTGDTYNFSIGEGYLEVTPIQMLNAAVAIANGGTLYRPQIVHHVTGADGKEIRGFKPQVITQSLPISSTYFSLIQQGMELAVNAGTARNAQVAGVRVAGKTGTAEFCDNLAQQRGLCYANHWPTHAWFVAFAPVERPEIALIVYIWNGGEGSARAAPVAQKILEYYFTRTPPKTP